MSTIKCDNLQNTAGTKTIPVNTVVDGSAKAWVNFNGTGTVAIRAAFNVSSITDNGIGNYTINLSSPLNDENYSVSATQAAEATYPNNCRGVTVVSQTSSAVNIKTLVASATIVDSPIVSVQFFR